jgi:hypothetical protein
MFLTLFGLDASDAAFIEGLALWALMGLCYFLQTRLAPYLGIVKLPPRIVNEPIATTVKAAQAEELATVQH